MRNVGSYQECIWFRNAFLSGMHSYLGCVTKENASRLGVLRLSGIMSPSYRCIFIDHVLGAAKFSSPTILIYAGGGCIRPGVSSGT